MTGTAFRVTIERTAGESIVMMVASFDEAERLVDRLARDLHTYSDHLIEEIPVEVAPCSP
jgi:hypothetical protein